MEILGSGGGEDGEREKKRGCEDSRRKMRGGDRERRRWRITRGEMEGGYGGKKERSRYGDIEGSNRRDVKMEGDIEIVGGGGRDDMSTG